MNYEEWERATYTQNAAQFIKLMMEFGFLQKQVDCKSCKNAMKLVNYTRNKDTVAWRCVVKKCKDFEKYKSIRYGSFFNDFSVDLRFIFRILIKYSVGTSQSTLIKANEKDPKIIEKIINKLLNLIPKSDFSKNKLGGPGCIVQIDETMLNYKCKSHRGRSPGNRTDALCIVEVDSKITRAFASVIPNKKESTLVPIIVNQVCDSSVIWTDEHRSYANLSKFNYIHDTVTHKYEFINHLNGVNTQAVESFNNIIKRMIKNQNGVSTIKRQRFLNEVCFKFNNKNDILSAYLNLLTIFK